MNRLPGVDARTRSSELIAFSSLGLIALGLIGLTVKDAAEFTAAREEIVSALERAPQGSLVEATNVSELSARSSTNHAATKLL